ncbi:PAS domain-containing protein [Devosia chinhatensis]|uniref:PAS domain-containing protein n=1 Tax=Devosia chinhatensis TaxID=429727 RepID=A0A0F5FF03_9HYPH|nr:PAS domain-containing protein [Devosia chinhatensis]KKB07378.1 hypothetical protein VE26_11400 [Devosia chinhatensis]
MADRSVSSELTHYIEGARVALALADVSEDNKLLLVNDAFCTLTGYGLDEIAGQNCRFLQVSPRYGRVDNREARNDLRQFLDNRNQQSVRTPIVNFTKEDKPFVNLLFMSRLRDHKGDQCFIFASQFDVSRSHPALLAQYDDGLSGALAGLSPVLQESGLVIEGSLATLSNSAAIIAQAKMILAQFEDVRS